MKSLVPILLASAFLLLPVHVAEAKTFGGFSVGQTFKMKVTKVTATKRVGLFGADEAVSVPRDFPKYRKNQTVTFRIRAKGKLTATKGLSIPFNHSKQGVNEYNRSRKRGEVTVVHNAEIKRRKDRALNGNLNFFIQDYSGAEPVFYTVIYKVRRA